MIIDLRRSIDLNFLFDPVLNASLDDLGFSPNRYAVMRLEALYNDWLIEK